MVNKSYDDCSDDNFVPVSTSKTTFGSFENSPHLPRRPIKGLPGTCCPSTRLLNRRPAAVIWLSRAVAEGWPSLADSTLLVSISPASMSSLAPWKNHFFPSYQLHFEFFQPFSPFNFLRNSQPHPAGSEFADTGSAGICPVTVEFCLVGLPQFLVFADFLPLAWHHFISARGRTATTPTRKCPSALYLRPRTTSSFSTWKT
ncbi:hypothetical protein LZ30DRAFT_457582 [Colletotrichum cereale]|nr:hypothetical protein LZ30DRAFT_457582 [Colletotrichum cereale]